MSRISINGISFDPAGPSIAAADAASPDTSKSNYILVQTTAPLSDADKTKLSELGVEIQEYVSENTYLCRYAPSDLTAVRALPFVSWAGVYLQGFKVNPSLRPPVSAAQTNAIGPLEAASSVSRTLRQVDIVAHDDVDPNSADFKAKVAAAAHVSPDTLTVNRRKIRLNVQEKFLNDVAAIDEVRHLEEVRRVKLYNNVAREIIGANVAVNGTPFQGAGQIVVVNDTGFDNGSTTNTHPAFTGRVVALVPIGRPGSADDPAGHGTHVCGSVLGDGQSATMGGVIQGTAPKAKLVMQSLLDAGGGLAVPGDLHDLFEPPYDGNPNARVHTNSWGSTVPGLPYNQSSLEIDDFVFNHPDCVVCFAAGNDGIDTNGDGRIDTGSIGSEAAAKNCITVGATESLRPGINLTYGALRARSFPSDPIFSDQSTDNPDGMAAFSSRGPTKEKRLKPDVCAPGTGDPVDKIGGGDRSRDVLWHVERSRLFLRRRHQHGDAAGRRMLRRAEGNPRQERGAEPERRPYQGAADQRRAADPGTVPSERNRTFPKPRQRLGAGEPCGIGHHPRRESRCRFRGRRPAPAGRKSSRAPSVLPVQGGR